MGWESRGGKNQYYTRTRRVNGKVVRTYFGCGEAAQAAAADDARQRDEMKQARRERAQWRAGRARIEALLDASDFIVDFIFHAHMAAWGYHYHRGEWRKRRGFDRRQAEAAAQAREAAESGAQAAEEPPPKQRRPMPPNPERSAGPGLTRNAFKIQVLADLIDSQAKPLQPAADRIPHRAASEQVANEGSRTIAHSRERHSRCRTLSSAKQCSAARPPPREPAHESA